MEKVEVNIEIVTGERRCRGSWRRDVDAWREGRFVELDSSSSSRLVVGQQTSLRKLCRLKRDKRATDRHSWSSCSASCSPRIRSRSSTTATTTETRATHTYAHAHSRDRRLRTCSSRAGTRSRRCRMTTTTSTSIRPSQSPRTKASHGLWARSGIITAFTRTRTRTALSHGPGVLSFSGRTRG